MLMWTKLGGILGAVLAVFGFGWYLGGQHGKAALSAIQAAQAAQTARAVLAERASTQKTVDNLEQQVAKYEAEPIDPITAGTARRLYLYAKTSCSAVPGARPHPGGTVVAGPSPLGPGRVEQALNTYIDACTRDGQRLNALEAAWPH